jgi:lactate dehydrogenase-like 2-hydroxyacid dehydrogenase
MGFKMAKPNVYITRALPVEVLALFQEQCDVEMNVDDHLLTKPELLEKIKNRDAVVVVGTRIDEEICQAVKSHCKIFTAYGVGYNNIDVAAATQNGIYVSNAPDVVTAATADLTWLLLLSTARQVIECDKFVRSGNKAWSSTMLMGAQVSGKTLGIIGGGRIGMAVAKRAHGFDMSIVYTDVQASPAFEVATGGKFVDQETLLRTADFVSIHVPLLPTTHHLIGADALNLMKDTAILINAARGPIVDEKALVKALRDGVIRGAGLDVFENEPSLEPGLADLPNVVLTPHVGTQTLDTRIDIGRVCAENIMAAIHGQLPPTCLNPEAKANRQG